MRFRLKAFACHLLGSACVLGVILGALYLGWYRWPGWYLTRVIPVVAVMSSVDVVLGPLLTLIVASPAKPPRGLIRDIAVIVLVQIVALAYGTATLWHGRPLYYAFSENMLQLVQAYDLDPKEVELARQQHSEFVPHWYSLPRWIWAPLPKDEKTRSQIVTAAMTGGNDVIEMPRYFRPWKQGEPDLRKQLQPVDTFREFSNREKQNLSRRMTLRGLAPDKPVALPMTGRSHPLLAVFDPVTLRLQVLLPAD